MNELATITVQGIALTYIPKYAAGHVLVENEAATLNQTLGENLRNNFAKEVAAAKQEAAKAAGVEPDADGNYDTSGVTAGDLDVDALQSAFDEYATTYEFGAKRGGGPRGPTDPIEREALDIAKERLRQALVAKGVTLKSVGAEKTRELAQALVEKYPDIREEAKRRVEAVSSMSIADIEL